MRLESSRAAAAGRGAFAPPARRAARMGWGPLRVLGGRARGRRLKSIPGCETRPPLARVRRAVFDILQPFTPGCRWLDLFAGTGSYGIEALSRGAAGVVMVEIDPRAVRVIRENLASTGLGDRATVICGDVLKEIPRLARNNLRFDIIGVAPPYFEGFGPKVLALLDHADILREGGRVYVQKHRTEQLPVRTETLQLAREYSYGDTVLSFYVPAGP